MQAEPSEEERRTLLKASKWFLRIPEWEAVEGKK
jgi:hypothetical protein